MKATNETRSTIRQLIQAEIEAGTITKSMKYPIDIYSALHHKVNERSLLLEVARETIRSWKVA